MNTQNKRFVIHEHSTTDQIHWDLMLEVGDVLQTYRLDKSPEDIINTPANAIKIADHSLKFLSYEGPVQDKTGSVRIRDHGTYSISSKSEQIKLNFNGKMLKGKFALNNKGSDNWILAAIDD